MEREVNPKISEWLLEQPWRGKYIDNLIARGRKPSDILEFVLGGCRESTISGAFMWSSTPEKHSFWRNISDKFEMEYISKGWKQFEKTIKV